MNLHSAGSSRERRSRPKQIEMAFSIPVSGQFKAGVNYLNRLGSVWLCLCLFVVASHTQSREPADQPLARTDRNSQIAHEQLLEKTRRGKIDVYFVGDSITRRWGATDYPDFLANWKENFHGWNAANFGWGADLTQNILWRLKNGEMDGVNPKIIVILAGTNNVGREPGDEAKVERSGDS